MQFLMLRPTPAAQANSDKFCGCTQGLTLDAAALPSCRMHSKLSLALVQ